MTTQSLTVDIYISAEDYLQHYQGAVHTVSCVSREGKRVQFPSRILQPFVRREGIKGTFVIHFDKNHKFERIEAI
ncbi:DUF2835 domain-containing protein [Reinekea marina]|uniref:DUF2835 domain-containing protein n=1 Tax=Reinekea marina TaxID=1310421 RepID=A0ABV7WTL4_9GAMM|nr:DUF2835 domain-containing protein [Reinekea marina]MDN3649644.1 DUF2835 domain-containing protein [Reinekea marina]